LSRDIEIYKDSRKRGASCGGHKTHLPGAISNYPRAQRNQPRCGPAVYQ